MPEDELKPNPQTEPNPQPQPDQPIEPVVSEPQQQQIVDQPIAAPQPAPAPELAPTPASIPTPIALPHPVNTAGVLVLQWLTYAFWGWTILVLGYLTAVVAAFSLYGSDDFTDTSAVAYPIAAAIILLPISFICDLLYSKREPTHKQGAAMVIMVIHAVIFALLAIVALITVAFSLVGLLLNGGDTTSIYVVIITAAVMGIVYGLTLARTLRPTLVPKARAIFRATMVLGIVGLAIWGIIGPAAQTLRTKDDRAVATSIQTLQSAIDSYTLENKVLPKTADEALQARSYGVDETKDLLARNLITYTPDVKSATTDGAMNSYSMTTTKTHYYQLCAVYSQKPQKKSSYSTYNQDDVDGYAQSIHSSGDVVGKNCYKLRTTSRTNIPVTTLKLN